MDSNARRGLFLISPTAIYAVGMLGVPLAAVIAISFATQDFLTIDWSPTLANYQEALTEPLYLELLGRSVRVAALVTLATVVLSFPVAYYVSFHVAPSRKSLWLFLITIPFWTS
ncbi:MAG: ABC transporter permease, partial [Pseudomonadota bacterium]